MTERKLYRITTTHETYVYASSLGSALRLAERALEDEPTEQDYDEITLDNVKHERHNMISEWSDDSLVWTDADDEIELRDCWPTPPEPEPEPDPNQMRLFDDEAIDLALVDFNHIFVQLRFECEGQGVTCRKRNRNGKFYVTLVGQTNDHTMGRLRTLVKTYFPKAVETSGGSFPPANVTMRVNPPPKAPYDWMCEFDY